MRSKSILRILLIVSTAASIGCASQSSKPLEPPSAGNLSTFERSMLAEETARAEEDLRTIPAASEAQFEFLLGQLALNEERYADALTHLEKASSIEKSPAPTLRKNLAQLYVRMGKVDQALTEVDRALVQAPNDLELLQLRAGILATRKEVPAAIEAYRKVIALSPPEHEDSYVLIASLYAQNGNWDAARSILRELIAKRPDSFFGYYYLGRMSEASGDSAAAEEAYEKALSINPDADAVSLDLARVYGVQKRFKEAIELCQKVVEDNPKNVAARNLLAQLLMGDNRVEKALQEFEKVGTLEGDPTETRLKIALIKLQRRDLDGAVTELNLVLSQHPENATAHYYLASAYAALKRPNDAVSEIKKIPEGGEYYVESRVLGVLMLQQEKKLPEAIALLNEALAAKTDDIKLLSLRASLEHEAGDDKSAVKTAERLIELEPNKDKHYFTLGVFLDELGEKEKAMNAMRKAIEIDPRNANALNYLGYTLAERGEKLDEAEQLIRRALEIEKDNGFFLDSLGWLYYRQGKYAEALKELEKAVKLVPADAVILEHYALVLMKAGNQKKALEVVQKALVHAVESDDKGVTERLEKLQAELKAPGR